MIRVVAICVFRHGDRILVTEGVDSVSGARFARPLGGGVEEGERSADTIVREVREEIDAEVVDLRFLGVIENLFTYEGRDRHEVVFVYDARLADGALYDRPEIALLEAGWSTPAVWRSLDSFGSECRLVPTGLAGLLNGPIQHPPLPSGTILDAGSA
ncbi:MAG: NUDIX hydrolase [Tepidisphaeraceae bacterium]